MGHSLRRGRIHRLEHDRRGMERLLLDDRSNPERAIEQQHPRRRVLHIGNRLHRGRICVSAPNYPDSAGLAEGLNGTTWTIEPTPSPGTSERNLLGVSCLTATLCTAVGVSVTSSGMNETLAERYSG